jgi:hypothetical protein
MDPRFNLLDCELDRVTVFPVPFQSCTCFTETVCVFEEFFRHAGKLECGSGDTNYRDRIQY